MNNELIKWIIKYNTLWEKLYSTKESFSTDLIQIFGYSKPSSGNNGRQITRHRIGIEKYILLDLNEIKYNKNKGLVAPWNSSTIYSLTNAISKLWIEISIILKLSTGQLKELVS